MKRELDLSDVSLPWVGGGWGLRLQCDRLGVVGVEELCLFRQINLILHS